MENMQKFHLPLDQKPYWVEQQEAEGRTLIMNAARPLYGDAVNDNWSLPFIKGRHYAAFDPSGDQKRLATLANQNRQNKAVILCFISDEEALEAGLRFYQEQTKFLIDIEKPRHRKAAIEKGFEVLNS